MLPLDFSITFYDGAFQITICSYSALYLQAATQNVKKRNNNDASMKLNVLRNTKTYCMASKGLFEQQFPTETRLVL